MNHQDETMAKLDRIAAILQLAHASEIAESRDRLRKDAVVSSILDGSPEWIASGELRAVTARETGQSDSTIKRRLASLVEMGVVSQRGSGSVVEYRATGLV